jgi:hypothetical protein
MILPSMTSISPPLGRLEVPEDLVGAIIFLASNESDFLEIEGKMRYTNQRGPYTGTHKIWSFPLDIQNYFNLYFLRNGYVLLLQI